MALGEIGAALQGSRNIHLEIKAAVQAALREELGGTSFAEVLLRSLRQALRGLAPAGDDEHAPHHCTCLRSQSRSKAETEPTESNKKVMDASSERSEFVVEEAEGPLLGVPVVSGSPVVLHLMPIVPEVSSQNSLPVDELDEVLSSLDDSDSQGTWATRAKEIASKVSTGLAPDSKSGRPSVGSATGTKAGPRTSVTTTGRRRSNTRTTMMDVFQAPEVNPGLPSVKFVAPASHVKPKQPPGRKPRAPAAQASVLQHQLHPDLLAEMAGSKKTLATVNARVASVAEEDDDERQSKGDVSSQSESDSDDDSSSSDATSAGAAVQKQPLEQRDVFSRLLDSAYFEFFITSCIFANSVLLGFQTDWAVQHMEGDEPAAFQVVDRLLSAVFFVELLLKLLAHKLAFSLGMIGCGMHWT
eukprot:TRINITY_DN87706_c0_g1_i1.p1 TRINITY_DN87706_c0_g1~~TRINITY_DN87706_c0_g1_i1.p1  ORF type:complete len:414 (+),score=84.42 TRINITY_DN87706_c0_g1_i1:3-1244(+)